MRPSGFQITGGAGVSEASDKTGGETMCMDEKLGRLASHGKKLRPFSHAISWDQPRIADDPAPGRRRSCVHHCPVALLPAAPKRVHRIAMSTGRQRIFRSARCEALGKLTSLQAPTVT
jgi:hypothetical protein